MGETSYSEKETHKGLIFGLIRDILRAFYGIFAQIIGWIGTSFVIIAYILVSAKKVTPTSNTYQLMNLLGAAGVGVNVWYQGAWSSVALQIVWGIIAVVSLVKTRKK